MAVMLPSDAPHKKDAMEFAFNLIDTSHSGFITARHLYFLSTLYGLSIKPHDIQAGTTEFADKIDLETFVHLLTQSMTWICIHDRRKSGPRVIDRL